MIMTQEEKELLLKDLCARLPYGVILLAPNGRTIGQTDGNTGAELFVGEGWKPYLRPISSMTEEEKKEYGKVCELDTEILANHPMNGEPFPALYNSQDWLNKKMFAYRTINGKDMFELGLAIKAPEGMYKL